ncbi:hypothetical protein [Paenibacillus tyrfis]|uniref:hypothetical protein n=1 Tax=Paenibacillus tyrfis TaxID=1501230 RepID=UPI0020A0E6DB|nr:hypothetical protein [Paenibacillus tyrfis]MCP1306445.1 hypothetical protein [Paenibacillus tyrfis]
MTSLISFEKHYTGNFIVRFKKQEIIVLPRAFLKHTSVSPQATSGSVEVDREVLPQLGFMFDIRL